MTPVTATAARGASNAPVGLVEGGNVVTTTWVLVIVLAVGVAVVIELRGH